MKIVGLYTVYNLRFPNQYIWRVLAGSTPGFEREQEKPSIVVRSTDEFGKKSP